MEDNPSVVSYAEEKRQSPLHDAHRTRGRSYSRTPSRTRSRSISKDNTSTHEMRSRSNSSARESDRGRHRSPKRIQSRSPSSAYSSRSRSRSYSSPRPRSYSRSYSRSRSRSYSRSRSRSYSRSYSRSRSRSGSRSGSSSRALRPGRNRRQGNNRWGRGKGPTESSKILIDNLSRNVNVEHIREIFGIYGPIKSAGINSQPKFPRERETNRFKQSAFSGSISAYIIYEDPRDADMAIEYMDDGDIDGQRVKITLLPLPSKLRPDFRNRNRSMSPRRNRGDSYRSRHGDSWVPSKRNRSYSRSRSPSRSRSISRSRSRSRSVYRSRSLSPRRTRPQMLNDSRDRDYDRNAESDMDMDEDEDKLQESVSEKRSTNEKPASIVLEY